MTCRRLILSLFLAAASVGFFACGGDGEKVADADGRDGDGDGDGTGAAASGASSGSGGRLADSGGSSSRSGGASGDGDGDGDGAGGSAGDGDGAGGSAGGGDGNGGGHSGDDSCTDGTCTGACVGSSCDDEWSCNTEALICTGDSAEYCGCDGATFTDSGSCPKRAFSHRGACEKIRVVDCNPGNVTCRRAQPECAEPLEYPQVVDGCWGDCIVITECACMGNDDCPDPENVDETVCYTGQGVCGPPIR